MSGQHINGGREQFGNDLVLAYGRLLERRKHRRRRVRLGLVAAASVLALVGVAFGAGRVFGGPAPEKVRQDLAAIDQGLPDDLRLNPDVANARAVAAVDTVTLYAADLEDGGYCTEIVTPGERGRGAICTTRAELKDRSIELSLPTDHGETGSTSVVIGGRINATPGTALELRYQDGSSDAIPLGDDRYFVFSVPPEHLAAAHHSALTFIARDSSGRVVGREVVPADWDADPVPDRAAPLYVGTRSNSSDLTKIYGLDGFVGVSSAVKLVLRYSDGASVVIPINTDRSYTYTVPKERVGDFMKPQQLVAQDRDGRTVATAPVAAVAYWRGRQQKP